MAPEHHNNQGPPGDEGMIPPAPGAPAGALAAELVVHGVLTYLRDGAHRREERVTRVLEALGAPSRLVFPVWARLSLAAAALLAIGVAIYFMGVPGERSALAAVSGAVAALRAPGDLRYEVRLEAEPGAGAQAGPTRLGAVVDTRETNGVRLTLVEHWPPRAQGSVLVGRDEKGEWAIRPEGDVEGVDRDDPRRYWPPWSVDGEKRTVDSLDTLLEQLPRRYTLTRGQRSALEGGTKQFERVSAARTDRAGPFPHRVELWIDPDTSMAERVEFRWDFAADAGDKQGPPPGQNADDGPRGPGGPPPSHDERHGPGGPGALPPPDGPRGSQPAGPGRLKLIAFQRVAAPDFPVDWFTPEGHRSK
jgi:hypothetical protein